MHLFTQEGTWAESNLQCSVARDATRPRPATGTAPLPERVAVALLLTALTEDPGRRRRARNATPGAQLLQPHTLIPREAGKHCVSAPPSVRVGGAGRAAGGARGGVVA